VLGTKRGARSPEGAQSQERPETTHRSRRQNTKYALEGLTAIRIVRPPRRAAQWYFLLQALYKPSIR